MLDERGIQRLLIRMSPIDALAFRSVTTLCLYCCSVTYSRLSHVARPSVLCPRATRATRAIIFVFLAGVARYHECVILMSILQFHGPCGPSRRQFEVKQALPRVVQLYCDDLKPLVRTLSAQLVCLQPSNLTLWTIVAPFCAILRHFFLVIRSQALMLSRTN